MRAPVFGVVGIGNAIVDVLAHSDDAFLERHGLAKGAMTLIDEDRAARLQEDLGESIECEARRAVGLELRRLVEKGVEAPHVDVEAVVAGQADAGELALPLKTPAKRAVLHGHCHQKAFDAMSTVEQALNLIPEMEVEVISSSCCGMAGAFGYGKETAAVSRQMAELDLLPAVRKSDPETLIIADGTSCRHQISDLSKREALHVARVLEMALVPN